MHVFLCVCVCVCCEKKDESSSLAEMAEEVVQRVQENRAEENRRLMFSMTVRLNEVSLRETNSVQGADECYLWGG